MKTTPPKTSRGQGRNSANFLQALAAGGPVDIPKSVTLTPEEAQLWPLFASARAAIDWRELDLVLLAEIVQLEARNRRYQAVVDEEGPVIKNQRGTPVANPLIAIISEQSRQQLALIRALGLTAGKGDPRTLRAHALQTRAFDRAFEDDDGLLARPSED